MLDRNTYRDITPITPRCVDFLSIWSTTHYRQNTTCSISIVPQFHLHTAPDSGWQRAPESGPDYKVNRDI